MNNQFIQRVIFDWNRIDNDSYLKGIVTIQNHPYSKMKLG